MHTNGTSIKFQLNAHERAIVLPDIWKDSKRINIKNKLNNNKVVERVSYPQDRKKYALMVKAEIWNVKEYKQRGICYKVLYASKVLLVMKMSACGNAVGVRAVKGETENVFKGN